MLISEVNNTKNLFSWAIVTSLKKKTCNVSFELNFHNFLKKRVDFVWIACYNIVTIEIDIFKFHISIIYNLVCPFMTYHLLVNNYLKDENMVFWIFISFLWIFNSTFYHNFRNLNL
jgi:hypothetical protein